MLSHNFSKKFLISITALTFTSGCSSTYARGAIYIENGLRAGDQAWDDFYNQKLEECKKVAPPKTPEAEACFGDTYDNNIKIEKTIEISVAALRSFWAAYASNADSKDLREIIYEDVIPILKDLPPEFFGGLKRALK